MKKSSKKTIKTTIVVLSLLLMLCIVAGILATFFSTTDTPLLPGVSESTEFELYLFNKKQVSDNPIVVYLGNNSFTVKNIEDYSVNIVAENNVSFDYIADGRYYSYSYLDFVKSFIIEKKENSFSIIVSKSVTTLIKELHNSAVVELPENVDIPNINVRLIISSPDKTYEYPVKINVSQYPTASLTLDKNAVVF